MYIQPPERNTGRDGVILPQGYSGNAFPRETPAPRPMPPPVSRPAPAHIPIEATEPTNAPPELTEPPVEMAETPDTVPEALPASAEAGEEARPALSGGILSRIPFLSSLLPPKRATRRGESTIPEWLLIGAVILLLFTEDDDNDILPFLLLLLLWD